MGAIGFLLPGDGMQPQSALVFAVQPRDDRQRACPFRRNITGRGDEDAKFRDLFRRHGGFSRQQQTQFRGRSRLSQAQSARRPLPCWRPFCLDHAA